MLNYQNITSTLVTIVFGIHFNFVIVLTYSTGNLKICFSFFTRQNVCTLKIRCPLFFPCAPDRHWVRNLARLEFSSNSFQIHFKVTSNLLANSLTFSSFL